MRQRTTVNVLLNVCVCVCVLRVQAAVDASARSRCKHFTEHQLWRRSGNKHTHTWSAQTAHHTHHHLDIRTLSPYLVDLQRWAFVAHGHRAEHHFSEHVSVWWALIKRKEEQSTQVWICRSSTQGCVICILSNDTVIVGLTIWWASLSLHKPNKSTSWEHAFTEWSEIQDMRAKNTP